MRTWIFGATLTVISFFTGASQGGAQFQFEKIQDTEILSHYRFFPAVRYDRVEGWFLGTGVDVWSPRVPGVTLRAEGGYGFSNKAGRYLLGLRKDLGETNKSRFGLKIFRQTASQDNWTISDMENSLAALLFREDFKDYFEKRGVTGFFRQDFAGRHAAGFELSSYQYTSMRKKTNWSLFGGDKRFRPNPGVAPGREVGLKLLLQLDWRDSPVFPLNGWYIEGIYETTGGPLFGGDFTTDGLFLTIKRYQSTFGSQRLIARGMLGTRKGSLYKQHIINLGGIGTLRGFRDKDFIGNRMVMLNVNYLEGGDLLRRIPLHFIPFWDVLSLGLFGEAGWAWTVDRDRALFNGFNRWAELKSDVGISLVLSEGILRVDWARRLDRSRDPWRVTVRLLEKY